MALALEIGGDDDDRHRTTTKRRKVTLGDTSTDAKQITKNFDGTACVRHPMQKVSI